MAQNYTDWTTADLEFGELRNPKRGLQRLRKELELIVAQHVTQEPTLDLISFRGTKCFFDSPGGRSEAFMAMQALQHIYKIIDAEKSGNVNAAIRHTYAFACPYDELWNLRFFKTPSFEAFASIDQRRQRAVAAGKTRVLLTPEQKRQAANEIRTLIRAGKSQRAACEELASKYGVGWRTLKRYDDSSP